MAVACLGGSGKYLIQMYAMLRSLACTKDRISILLSVESGQLEVSRGVGNAVYASCLGRRLERRWDC